jgi:hypothetical protein
MVEQPDHPTYLLRVRLADRPGSLSAVATRVSAVKGDLVGIDILDRAPGSVVDELIVTLPSDDLLDLLLQEIDEVEDTHVEAVVPVEAALQDLHQEWLRATSDLVEATTVEGLLRALCDHGHRMLRADWGTVGPGLDADPLTAAGDVPPDLVPAPPPGVEAGAGAGAHGTDHDQGDGSVLRIELASTGLLLTLGRTRGRFYRREQDRARALVELADALLRRLAQYSAR